VIPVVEVTLEVPAHEAIEWLMFARGWEPFFWKLVFIKNDSFYRVFNLSRENNTQRVPFYSKHLITGASEQ
jgi:hypothetical protein